MKAENLIVGICIYLILSGIIGALIGSNWDQTGRGFIYGLLGPIGWIIITQLPHIKPNQPIPILITETCIKCHEVLDFTELLPGSYVCPFCKHGFSLNGKKGITADPYEATIPAMERIYEEKIVIKCPRCKSDLEINKGTQGECECSECSHVFKI